MYQSLQAGRAVAASLVVLFHLGGIFAQDKYFGFKALDRPFAWADAGVEYFFVLSGFLITIAHRADFGRPAVFGRYVAKRTLRIYPTYWLICLAVCGAALVAPTLRQALPSDAATLLAALALIPQDPAVVGGTGAPILFVAWSLQYEMLFYAVVGLAVLNRALGVIAALALLAVRIECGLGATCGFPTSFLDSNLIFLFAMGVAGAYFVQSRVRLPFALPLGIAAIVAFVGFGVFETVHGRDTLGIDRRLVFGAFGTVIVVALARAEDAGALRLGHRWVRLLGDSSYALYLLHIPVISLLAKLLVKAGVSGALTTVAAFIAVFVACLATAVVFHLTIERRLLAALKPRGESPTAGAIEPNAGAMLPLRRNAAPVPLGRPGTPASGGGR